ncbi:MAG: M23 family metallopeptidase [Gemmatimonadaceae bacterium]|nr:M23 family metallopeptidase [Gemmatimonadaceae bacterium]
MRLVRPAFLLLTTLVGCQVPDVLRERVHVLSPYERYAESLRQAGLDSTALGRDWLLASDSAMRAPLTPSVPFTEAGFYSRTEARAVAFRFDLHEGQRLDVDVRHDGLPVRMFVDLFRQELQDSVVTFAHQQSASTPDSSANGQRAVRYEVRESGTYVLRLQPELLRDGRYSVEVRTAAILAFPVQDATNRAVQSLFGVDRDGGRRRHHGIDIFAPRGTPALAATDGYVRSISPNQLGGNVVWLSDTVRGQTLYYAHLDRHHVRAGDQVKAGDTLGFVGNTGNARTTRPHLHFGIYRRGMGPIDPWPWVRIVSASPARLVADTARLGTTVMSRGRRTPVRLAPAARSDTVQTLEPGVLLQIVGAQGSFYRVQLPTGESGYLPAQALSPH